MHETLREPTRALRNRIPDTWSGFMALHDAATPGEVAELLGVALLMDGGPASVYAPRAWEAFMQFRTDAVPAKAAS